MLRSNDPRVGDRVRIYDDIFGGEVRGTVRAVYSGLVVSIILDESDLSVEERSSFVRDPVTGNIHWTVAPGDYEIFGRRVQT